VGSSPTSGTNLPSCETSPGDEAGHRAIAIRVLAASTTLEEATRDGQTEILKAFYSFAESNQARLTETERESA
jgi:hypothetical protein